MQYLSVMLPVAAMISGALASPQWGSDGDACLAAVTGKGALGDAGLRASHCKSFLATTVTPIATTTVYITGNANDNWKRSTVAYCPNEVPNYASACDDAAYTSACSVFGYTDSYTTTVAPTTTTKTIWVKPTGGAGTCTATTVTVGGATTVTATVATPTTVTILEAGSITYTATTITVTDYSATATTVTVTDTDTCTVSTATSTVTDTATCSTSATSSCNVSPALATKLANNFAILLEQTNVGGTYNQEVSNETLDPNFVDISDSVNFMAGVALGSISFDSQSAFDAGQGSQPPVSLDILNIWNSCDDVTWRWRISSLPYPVTGISHFTVSDAGLITKNWVEFDNGAWLQSYGQNCSFGSPNVEPPTPVSPNSKRGLLDM